MQQKKWLLKIFFLSIGLNCCLFSLLFFFTLKEHFFFTHLAFSFKPSHKIAPLPSTHPLTTAYNNCSFQELVELLQNKSMVTKELSIRDLALTLLVKEYYFAIEEALPQKYLQKEELPSMITFYSDINEHDFACLYAYAKSERYPYSDEGLFIHLQNEYDSLLASTFIRTERFHLVRALFSEREPPLEDTLLLQLLLEGDWKLLENLYKEQRERLEFSSIRRIQFLSNYLEKQSPLAAYLLLIMDYEHVLEKFDDHKLLTMIGLIEKKSTVTVKFIEALAFGTHTERVVQAAQEKLESFGGLFPTRFTEPAVIGELRPVFREPFLTNSVANTYIVEAGDSLWLIAKRHNVSIESLKQVNHLQNDVVRPGQRLKIP